MPDSTQAGYRIAMALYLSGAVTIAVGVGLGIALQPFLFALAAVGVSDLVLGWLFATGRIGPAAARRKATTSGDAASIAEADPSFNPYARED